MAYAIVSKPGTEYGPCVDEACGHTDCAATRADAAAVCSDPPCGQPIGYGRPWCTYQGKPYHHSCLHEAVDAGRL